MREELAALRACMRTHDLDAYIVPTSDYHASEYVSGYFKARAYLSGFTGSSGTLIVLTQEAVLFTDARYFLQAELELADSGIALMRMDEPGVLSPEQYLHEKLAPHARLGADGRTLSVADAESMLHALADKEIAFVYDVDLVTEIWENRPPLPHAPVFYLHACYSGVTAADKLKAVRGAMAEKGANAHLITTLDDIAWLFNIRGGDVAFNPIALSYALIGQTGATLFIDESKLEAEVVGELRHLLVDIRPYGDVYDAVRNYTKDDRILLSSRTVNYTLYRTLKDRATLIDADNPAMHMKARKNAKEQANLKSAHVKDGLAMVHLIHWLKTSVGHESLTELSVAERADALRLSQAGCIGPSFSTIAGYKEHAAIVHYTPTPESSLPLRPEGLLLVDSGGQYFEGTTDITRTIALGPVTSEEKRHFTLVLKGMLALTDARFMHGCCGYHLDVLARGPLWRQGLDYKHGTGHGIGYMLCVHEPPVGIRWKQTGRYDTAVIEPGMVLSNEPGVYIAGSHGVRIENQMLVQKCCENEHGNFLCFETLTLVPIDLDAIDPGLLTAAEREQLNAYHAHIYERLGPLLPLAVREWLQEATRAL